MNALPVIPPYTEEDFAHFGDEELVYVREMEAKEVVGEFPAARSLPPTAKLFVLHAADGTPILLGDTRETVLASAREHSFQPVSLH